MKGHLRADHSYQMKSVRFLENHDEERSIVSFGYPKVLAAAVIKSTVKGLRFYHDGQWEGETVRLPVQLGRYPDDASECAVCKRSRSREASKRVSKSTKNEENKNSLDNIYSIESSCKCTFDFYRSLLYLTRRPIFKTGTWRMIDAKSRHHERQLENSIFAWIWEKESEQFLVIVNYSNRNTNCLVDPGKEFDESETLVDELSKTSVPYFRQDGTSKIGFQLSPFHSFIFYFRNPYPWT